MKKDGKSNRAIMRELGVDRYFIDTWYSRWQEGKGVEDAPRAGRPGKMDIHRDSVIALLQKGKKGTRTTALALNHQGKKISRRTVQRLAHSSDLVARRRSKKPLLTPVHKGKRLDFAVRHNDTRFWKNVVYTDESYFRCGTKNTWVWVPKGTIPPPNLTQKFAPSVMVWGGICARGKTTLHVFETGTRVNSILYQQCLRGNLIAAANHLYHDRAAWKLMQDGATVHTSRSTRNWLKRQRIRVVEGWPPQSPDLNPIENLWSIIGHKVGLREPRTRMELHQYVLEEWDNIDLSLLERLTESMPRRIKAVVDAEGGHTRY